MSAIEVFSWQSSAKSLETYGIICNPIIQNTPPLVLHQGGFTIKHSTFSLPFKKMHYFITCAAGLESVLKKEIELAGYKVMSNQPTLIRFQGDLSAIAKVNLRSRV